MENVVALVFPIKLYALSQPYALVTLSSYNFKHYTIYIVVFPLDSIYGFTNVIVFQIQQGSPVFIKYLSN